MEADFARFYRADLSDVFVGGLSPRKTAVLVRNLPADSATFTAVRAQQRQRPAPKPAAKRPSHDEIMAFFAG